MGCANRDYSRLASVTVVGVTAVVILSLVGSSASADWCDDPWSLEGPRACDFASVYSGCATVKPLSGAGQGEWVADYNTLEETQAYISNLDGLDDDFYDYLSLIPLGTSWGMGLAIDAPAGTLLASAPLVAARITSNASDTEQRKPAVLLVCGVHAHEWLPQEVCLGLVDYYVKAANGLAPYQDDQAEVQALLIEREIWFVVNANPAGRMRDDVGTSYGATQIGTYRQRKNRQWDPDRNCSDNWAAHASAGRSGNDVKYDSAKWNYPGINLGTAFSTGWGDQADMTFGRGLIAKLPGDVWELAPEQKECLTDDHCLEAFGDDTAYSNCLTYVLNGDELSGCFLYPAFDGDGYNGLVDCQDALDDGLPVTGEYITPHTACLTTQTDTIGEIKTYVWECGNTGARVDSVEDAWGRPISWSNPNTPDLLKYCHYGLYQSCNTDDDCSSGARDPGDYDVQIGGKYTPHYMPEDSIMDTQLYCASKDGRGRFHHCAVSGNRSCGSEKYAGAHPFEAVEARLIRELVNNYNFSLFLDLHSNRNDFMGFCNELDADGECVDINLSAGIGHSRANLRDMHREAVNVFYHLEADLHWKENYGYTESLPAWIDLVPDGVAKPRMGTPPAWPTLKAEAHGAEGSPITGTIWDATSNNFDRGTQRYIPSFQWEFGTAPVKTVPGGDMPLWNTLMKCENGDPEGGKPKSRMMLENQLVGARALISYLAEQAEVPNVGRDASSVNFVSNRHDVALQSLRIHDSSGRGVQQTETRWDEINLDENAVIYIPAGRWYVSFDYIAGGEPGDFVDAQLSLAIDDISPSAMAPSTFLLSGPEGFVGSIPTGERRSMTRVYDFKAGTTYRISAENSTNTASDNDDPANDVLVSKVKVLDCQEAELGDEIPNGLDRDSFCRTGLPSSNASFECWFSKGTCRECWITPTEEHGCDEGEICVGGICEDPSTGCLSAKLEDEYEGDPESLPWFYGSGSHVWARTLHREGGAQDVDEAWFTGHPFGEEPPTPEQNGTFILNVLVKDHCWTPPTGDPEMAQLEIYVDQQVSVGVFKHLYNWSPGSGADGWQIPRVDSGYELVLTYDEVVGVLNDQPLRVRVRNEGVGTPSVLYNIMVTLDGPGLINGYQVHSAQAPWVIGSQDILSLDGDGYTAPIFEFQVADEMLTSGEWAYFSPRGSATMSQTTVFVAVDSQGNVTGSNTLDAGRAIDLGALDPRYSPYKVKVQNSEEALAGSVYYCPQHVDCDQFDPRRDRCCGGGTGDESLCCTDEYGTSTCVNVLEDELNCGGCGVECGAGQLCLDGICAVSDGASCAQTACPGETWCCMVGGEPTCRALLLDDENCGSCGSDCPWYGGCLDGYCGVKDSEECGYNCGGNLTCCWWLGYEECVNTDSDPYFCGDCHTVCDPSSECVGGKCVPWWEVYDPCYYGERNCGGPGEVFCLYVMDDEQNCGACGNVCSPGSTCVSGVCTAPIRHYDPEEIQ